MRRAKLGIHIETCSVKGCSTPASNNVQGVVLFLFNHSKHRHLCWKSQEESLKISWTHRPAHALWLLLIWAGVYWQEDVRKLLLLLCMVFLFFREESRLKIRTLSCILSQTKKVHLYKALVISQIKNWIQMLMIVELVSIQVMFCPSFPQVSCDQGYWDHVTCGLPFVILCLEITVRQGQQRDAQLSSLPSANHFNLMIKNANFIFLS